MGASLSSKGITALRASPLLAPSSWHTWSLAALMILAVFASREQPPELHRPSSSGSIREGIAAAPGHPTQLQGVLTPTQHPAELTACGLRPLLEKNIVLTCHPCFFATRCV